MDYEAVLSSEGRYTSFTCKGKRIRFRTSEKLDKYTGITEWDNGYIVVTAKYGDKEIEDYIDLIPILENLYIDPNSFLKDIKEVRIKYD